MKHIIYTIFCIKSVFIVPCGCPPKSRWLILVANPVRLHNWLRAALVRPFGLNESAGETSYDTFSNFCAPLVNPTTWDEIVIFTLREKDMERHGKL